MNTESLIGTVVAVQANFYQVRLDVKNADSSFLLCVRRAILKKIGQKIMVGDRVVIEEPDWSGNRGAIAEVLHRESELDRPPIANVNQIIIVFSMAEPAIEPDNLSKFLVKAECTGLDVNVCLNKCDLVSDEEIKRWNERLKGWGYDAIFISVSNLIGIDELKERLNNKISILAGLSGVGKSSLINYLIPELNIRVSEVSGKLSRGRHTTRHVELFALPTGGLIADSPGFNQPDLDCSPEDLGNYFPEVRERLKLGKCQFNDCSHGHEPNCIIRGDWDRYEHYRTLLEEAKLRQQQLKEKKDIESSLKIKNTGKGNTKLEPKLEAKKYRRIARKTQLQELQQLYDEDDI